MIQIKRAYEQATEDDGQRILVDRLWPRGVTKERAKIDRWAKELAPSTELRKWFSHDPAKWPEFQKRYRKELSEHESLLHEIGALGRIRKVTLIYGARDQEHNEALVLQSILQRMADA